MTKNNNEVEERFQDKFDGLWLDGMTDYENETNYDELETKQKLIDHILSERKIAQEEILKKILNYPVQFLVSNERGNAPLQIRDIKAIKELAQEEGLNIE